MSLLHDNYNNPPAIQLNKVSFKRGSEVVLKQLSITIPVGQWVALAGRNGSGKSTLARLLNGLLQADSGAIAIHGIPLQAEQLYDIRSRIGYIFASPDDQFIGLTIRDDIAFGLENLRLPSEQIEQRIVEYAELLNLTPLLDRHPATLSGGQKQRAALAAVLAMKPDILILDEATSMLDSSFRDYLLTCLKRWTLEQQLTVITISHDVKELVAADRLIMLNDGAILADGKPENLLVQQPLLEACRLQAPYTLKLCRELKLQGIDIGELLSEQEVLSKLWELRSSRSHIATKIER